MGSSMEREMIHDRLDADAVCGTCGNVNPEGTLMCKTCGNNLRDQRQRRMTAEVQLEDNLKGEDRRYLVSGLLTVFGLLLVLWSALNVDRITDWLVAGTSNTQALSVYWSASESARFSPLAERLRGIELSSSDLAQLAATAGTATGFSGVYAVFDGRLSDQGRWIGVAAVEEELNQVHFVGQLHNGIELRGTAFIQGNSLSALMNTVSADIGGDYYAVQGVALRQMDGGFELYGQSDFSEMDYQIYAYPLPVNGEATMVDELGLVAEEELL